MTIRRMVGAGTVVAAIATGCTRIPVSPPAEAPTLDVTSWTTGSELFMEYPPLVAGQQPIFAVHLTRARDFSPMTSGRPSLELQPETGGAPIVLRGTEPSRPGVFRIEATLPAAGRYRWALSVDAPGLIDRHELGAVTLFATEAEAQADAEGRPANDPAAIAYLKEPQWTNGFATALVEMSDLRRAVRVPAVIESLTGGEAVVSAPAAGRLVAAGLPTIGDRVEAGAALGQLQPRLADDGTDRATLAAVVTEAQISLESARADLARAERLVAERALPARRVEEGRRAVGVSEARLTAAQARLAQRDEALRSGGGDATGNAFVLRAPITGRVAAVSAALGASYEEGAVLFRIIRTDVVELQAHVPASMAPLGDVGQIELELSGRPDPLVLVFDHMHDAGVIDPVTRALPVRFQVQNRSGQLLIGQTGTAILYSGALERAISVPKEAVLMEAGRPYVFVQTGGERFARRFVEIGARDGDRVGVRAGLQAGERVVTRGAYDVQLASAGGGIPAEGHVH